MVPQKRPNSESNFERKVECNSHKYSMAWEQKWTQRPEGKNKMPRNKGAPI